MLLRLAVAFCVCVGALASTHSDLPQEVLNGFNAGRSGNMILRATEHKASDSVAILMDETQSFFAGSGAAGVPNSVPVNHVADVIARAIGVSAPNPHFNAEFVSNNLFRRPKANILVTVESVGEESVSSFGLRGIRSLLDEHTAIGVDSHSYPLSSIATAATLATGAMPSEHGVVASSWKKGTAKVSAYSSPSAWSNRATTADVLAQTFDGQSLLLSVSADSQLAKAFSTHPTLSAHRARNSISIAQKDSGFGPTAPTALSERFVISNSALLNSISNTGLWGGANSPVSVDVSQAREPHRRVTVSYPATKPGTTDTYHEKVVFDLRAPEQAAVFAELMYVESLPQVLKADSDLQSLVADNTPDLLSVSISSLSPLIEKHGRTSTHAVAAMHLIDVALPQLMAALNGIYSGRAVSQVVLMGSHRSFFDSIDSRQLLSTVNRLLPGQDLKTYYPQVYITADTSALSQSLVGVCAVLATELDKLAVNVYCPPVVTASASAMLEPTAFFQLHETTTQSVGAPTNITSTGVFRYQIVLWLSIALALAVLGAAYSLAWMTFKKDTLLYSTFNPNWESSRKAR